MNYTNPNADAETPMPVKEAAQEESGLALCAWLMLWGVGGMLFPFYAETLSRFNIFLTLTGDLGFIVFLFGVRGLCLWVFRAKSVEPLKTERTEGTL